MKIKVLVADDNATSRELIRAILGSEDYQILEAADGEEALARTRLNHPDAVLLDVQMPLMDGFAVLRQLRQDPDYEGLPVAAITAYGMAGDRQRALAAGFDDYIPKPIHPASFRVSLSKLLARRPSSPTVTVSVNPPKNHRDKHEPR